MCIKGSLYKGNNLFRNLWWVKNFCYQRRKWIQWNISSFQRRQGLEGVIEFCGQFLEIIFRRCNFFSLLLFGHELEYSWRFFSFFELISFFWSYFLCSFFINFLRWYLLANGYSFNIFRLCWEWRGTFLFDDNLLR